MKTLWKDGEMELVIQDERNYMYARFIRTVEGDKEVVDIKKPAYFTSIDGALRHIVRLRANERCKDLTTWMKEYRAQIAYFERFFFDGKQGER